MKFIDFSKSVILKCIGDGKYHQFSNISSHAEYDGSDIKLETDFGDFKIDHVHSDCEEIDNMKVYKCDRIKKIS